MLSGKKKRKKPELIYGVIQDNEILMVKEKIDGKWALLGGWADVGFTPREVLEKEVREETGLEVKATRILAVFDKKCHPHPPFYTYKIFIECKVIGGNIVKINTETLDIRFQNMANISTLPLSIDRNTLSQINMAIEESQIPRSNTIFD